MFLRIHTSYAPWTIIEGNCKRYARGKALDGVITAIEARIDPLPLRRHPTMAALGITRWKQTAPSRYVPRFDLETVSPTATTHWASASVSDRPAVLQSLLNQLIVGGRMIIPVGETRQPLVIIRRTKDGRRTRKLSARRLCSDDGRTPNTRGETRLAFERLATSS